MKQSINQELTIEQSEAKQRRLMEFFDMVEKPTWMVDLRTIVKSKKMNIWDVSVKELSQEYLKRIEMKKDLNQLATGMLICSILLKYKSHRIGLRELEDFIEDEIKEIEEETIEEPEEEIIDTNQISLDEFTKHLSSMIKKTKKRKKYHKKTQEYVIPESLENFKTTGIKLLEHLYSQNAKTFDYQELKETANTNNNLFMTLLYLNDDHKLKLSQKELYGNLKVKVK